MGNWALSTSKTSRAFRSPSPSMSTASNHAFGSFQGGGEEWEERGLRETSKEKMQDPN